MQTLDSIDAASLRTDIPAFRPGDTVKVHVRVVEGNRTRVQVFQGVVIRRHGGGVRETFTVRKVSFGVGVERTFPVHSPVIDHLEVVMRGDVRRAKLYYLRELRGKKAKIKEKRDAAPESLIVASLRDRARSTTPIERQRDRRRRGRPTPVDRATAEARPEASKSERRLVLEGAAVPASSSRWSSRC